MSKGTATIFFLLSSVIYSNSSLLLGQLSAWRRPEKPADLAEARSLTADFLPSCAPAGEFYSALGVTFSGASASLPVGGVVSVGPYREGVILNQPLTGESEWKPLVVRFSRPVSKAAFLPGIDPTGEMLLTAFTDAGELLGTVSVPATASSSMPGHFSG